MKKIDASYLPAGYQTERKEGLYAEFYPDGQLKHFGFYMKGNCRDTWALYLKQGIPEGKVEKANGLGSTPDYILYERGGWEMFNHMIDHDDFNPMDWEAWVKKEIEKIRKTSVELKDFDPDNPISLEKVREFEKRLLKFKHTENYQDVDDILHFNDFLYPISSGPMRDETIRCLFRQDCIIIMREDCLARKLKSFELIGSGWSKEVREHIERIFPKAVTP